MYHHERKIRKKQGRIPLTWLECSCSCSSQSSSPSSSGPKIVNNSRPRWLNDDPCGLTDNHDDPKGGIWTSTREEKHWGECRDMLESHDKRLLDDWKDEINTQLLVVRSTFHARYCPNRTKVKFARISRRRLRFGIEKEPVRRSSNHVCGRPFANCASAQREHKSTEHANDGVWRAFSSRTGVQFFLLRKSRTQPRQCNPWIALSISKLVVRVF